jgi:N-acetylmuramoyl-L-alanine amidase
MLEFPLGVMRATRTIVPLTALGIALFIFGGLIRAADANFPIYFANSKLILKSANLNREVYLPLKPILEFMAVPYTDALALETLTIRSGNSRLVVTKNSALMSFNEQIVLLPSPILREDGQWLVPVEFLSTGLTRLTSTEFRYRSGTSRIFAENVDAPELEMNAQTLGPITRLTLRCAVPLKLEVKRDNQRAVITIDRSGLDPTRERLDHRDALVRSIAYDDSDGEGKIILDITREVADIRVTPTDNNRIFFIDVLRRGEPVTAVPPPVEPPAAAAKPDAVARERRVRVVVIDPGHGGMDAGAKGTTVAEKDFTLALARRLRTALQARLGTTVLLTRDSDISLDNEARSAVANNNQANLFISLHAGYSSKKIDADSSIFVMKENFGEASTTSVSAAPARDQLFLPWYLGYRIHRQASISAANILQEELTKAIPGSKFPVRSAPLAVLSSATMPSLLVELGNLNNSANAQTLMDNAFQTRMANTMAEAVQRFSESPQAAAN